MKAFFRLLAFGAMATVAASCGRATYSFNSNVPAYLGTTHTQPLAAPAPAAPASSRPATVVSKAIVAPPVAATARTSAPAVVAPQSRQAAPPAPGTPAEQAPALAAALASAPAAAPAESAEATAPARPARPSLAQRLLVKGLMATQLRKIKAARQNLARAHETQEISRAGRAALIALVGAVLVAIVIAVAENGGSSSTFLILTGIIGYALLISGIVLLVLSLVNG